MLRRRLRAPARFGADRRVHVPGDPPPATPQLELVGVTPRPELPRTNGVAALAVDGRLLLWERRLATVDDHGTLHHSGSSVGVVEPGGEVAWFRAASERRSELRRVADGDLAGDHAVWREQPFDEDRSGRVAGGILAHDLASGALRELHRAAPTATLGRPVVLGRQAYWEQHDPASGASGLWSARLAAGLAKPVVDGAGHVAVDRGGAEPHLLYVTEDAGTVVVHRRAAAAGGGLGPDREVLVHELGRGLSVLGLAGRDGEVALAVGRREATDLPPEFTAGRVLVHGADGDAEYL